MTILYISANKGLNSKNNFIEIQDLSLNKSVKLVALHGEVDR